MKALESSERIKRTKPPVLVIGCGGTGTRILRLLQEKYFEEVQEVFENLPIELLALDTLIKQEGIDLPPLPKEDWLSLGPVQLDKFIQSDYSKEEFIQTWFNNRQYAGLMSTGAMQIRAFGRLALFLKLPQVVSRLSSKIRSVIKAAHLIPEETTDTTFTTESGASLQVHLVGNIGGGTGSGIMLDLAYLLRYIADCPIVIYGHLIMPETVSDIQIKNSLYANAYAFLKELDNFNLNNTLYRRSSPVWRYLSSKEGDQGKSSFVAEEYAGYEPNVSPFDYTYLLSPFTLESSFLNEDFFYEIISEKIFLSSMNEVGDREYERVCNIRTDYVDSFYKSNEIAGKPRSYASYGVSTLRVKTDTIKNKIKEYTLTKIKELLKDKKTEKILIAEERFNDVKKEAGLDKLEAPVPEDDDNETKKEAKKWFSTIQGNINRQISENKHQKTIRKEALNCFFDKKEKDIITIKMDRRFSEPEPRIREESDIDRVDPGKLSDLVAFHDEFKSWMQNNALFYFYDRMDEEFDKIAKRCEKIRKWAEHFIKGLREKTTTGAKEFDNILFYNFDVERITHYITSHGGVIDKLNELEDIKKIFNAYDPEAEDKKQEKLGRVVGEITDEVFNEFETIYKKKENEPVDKRLTVSNFLSIMFADNPERLEDVLTSYKSIANPCWNYNDHFSSCIFTIALIGCKKNNYLFDELEGWNFFGATLEPTGQEEDPFEIPLVISQYGLPLLGYKKLPEYKKAYQLMREKFKTESTRFGRQFHLDKRWENDSNEILIDPFQDVPDSYVVCFKEQIFSFAWYLNMIEENNKLFTLSLPGTNVRENLNSDGKAGVSNAVSRFIALLPGISVEEGSENILLEEKIKKDLRAAQGEMDGPAFKTSLEKFMDDLQKIQNDTTMRADKNTLERLISFVRFFVEYDYQFLPDLKESLQELIGSIKQQ